MCGTCEKGDEFPCGSDNQSADSHKVEDKAQKASYGEKQAELAPSRDCGKHHKREAPYKAEEQILKKNGNSAVWKSYAKDAEDIVEHSEEGSCEAGEKKQHKVLINREKGFGNNHLKSLPRAERGPRLSLSP